MNKRLLIFIAVLLVLGGGFYLYNRREAQAPVSESFPETGDENQPLGAGETMPAGDFETPTSTPPAPPASAPSESVSRGVYSTGEEGLGSDIQVLEVDYNGTSFSPASLSVKVDDYVFFKNSGSSPFWPAAVPESSYEAFDAGQSLAPGKQFKFQFMQAGTFRFQDKLNPSAQGTITVVR